MVRTQTKENAATNAIGQSKSVLNQPRFFTRLALARGFTHHVYHFRIRAQPSCQGLAEVLKASAIDHGAKQAAVKSREVAATLLEGSWGRVHTSDERLVSYDHVPVRKFDGLVGSSQGYHHAVARQRSRARGESFGRTGCFQNDIHGPDFSRAAVSNSSGFKQTHARVAACFHGTHGDFKSTFAKRKRRQDSDGSSSEHERPRRVESEEFDMRAKRNLYGLLYRTEWLDENRDVEETSWDWKQIASFIDSIIRKVSVHPDDAALDIIARGAEVRTAVGARSAGRSAGTPHERNHPIAGFHSVHFSAGFHYLPERFMAESEERIAWRRHDQTKGRKLAIRSTDADLIDAEKDLAVADGLRVRDLFELDCVRLEVNGDRSHAAR